MPSSAVFHTSLATVSWTWGSSGVLRGAISGEVDATNRDDVIAELRSRLAAPGLRAVHLDAARLAFCDARSLIGLAEVAAGAQQGGLPVEVTNLGAHLTRLLDLLDLAPPGSERR